MGEAEDVLVTLQTLLGGARCLHAANIRKLAMAVRAVNLRICAIRPWRAYLRSMFD
jgi:hypothetical protein